MKRDCTEFAIPQIWVQSLICVVIQLNIDYFSIVVHSTIIEGRCNILSMLFPCVGRGISYLADMRFLPLGNGMFNLGTARRSNRIILIHIVAFTLDPHCYNTRV